MAMSVEKCTLRVKRMTFLSWQRFVDANGADYSILSVQRGAATQRKTFSRT